MPTRFKVIRPGDLQGGIFKVTTNFAEVSGGEDDIDEEQLPTTASLPPFEPLVLWTDPNDPTNKVEVIPELACRLRPHQREGVQFLFECAMGLRGFEGQGCILADDMGLGKTLMSITTLWTLLNQGFVKGESAVRKIMVVCPTSLVGNWDNEIRKWVGDRCPTFAVKQDPKKIIRNFLMHRGKAVLIVSYETQRLYAKLFEDAKKLPMQGNYSPCCDMLICDEAHKLKNAESELSKCLNALPARKRILLSGTPMQNELTEFFNMVNFCNPNVIGTLSEFRRRYERPILAAREPDALESEVAEAARLQKELSVIVNEFILKRGNILNAQHLPPKLVQYVCCRLTPLQEALYARLLSSKEIRHIREGKQTNTLNSIRQLINICSHPHLILEQYNRKLADKEPIDDDLAAMVELIPRPSAPVINKPAGGGSRLDQLKSRSLQQASSSDVYIDPEQSGKMAVLFRMMQAMRAVQRGERIVVVSNYTSTLDLIEAMCNQKQWPVMRLDGSVTATKRTKLVEDFNNPLSNAFAFLLSSKAGGCGINLIGGNRLVLFDPDWNPASDKQAAGRIWREGQKRRCFIYRFMSTGSIEEKIIQRQLSKEGLADIVDDKEQINQFSSDELKQLFTLLKDTRSDTHDTLQCPRCNFVKSRRGMSNAGTKLSERQQAACLQFLDDFEVYLQQESVAYQRREATRIMATDNQARNPGVRETMPFHDRLDHLRQQLRSGHFETLTAYSRRQREVFQEIENDLKGDLNEIVMEDSHPTVPSIDAEVNLVNSEAPAATASKVHLWLFFPPAFSVYSQFLRQWTDLVPTLMSIAGSSEDSGGSGTQAAEDGGNGSMNSVEQEGCPEETDLNKWSHHCVPLSCDDELFGKALGDDEGLVSFIFGLEINWSLLEQRELETREENERRKLQQIKDLEELNARRQADKQRRESGVTDGGESEEGKAVDDSVLPSDGKKQSKKRKSTGKGPENDGAGEKKKSGRKKRAETDFDTDQEDDIDEDVSSPVKKKAKKAPLSADLKAPQLIKQLDAQAVSQMITVDITTDSVEKGKDRSKSVPNVLAEDGRHIQQGSVGSQDNSKPRRRLHDNKSTSSSSSSSSSANSAEEHFEQDFFFDADRKKLHKLLDKGKLPLHSFDLFWKALKTENNDWRCLFADDGRELFTRTPGFKAQNWAKYRAGVDYFVEIAGLIQYFILQCRLYNDDRLADLLMPLHPVYGQQQEPSTETTAAASSSKMSPVLPRKSPSKSSHQVSSTLPQSEVIDVASPDIVGTKSKGKRKLLISDDEDEESNAHHSFKDSKTLEGSVPVPKKRRIAVDDDGESDEYFAAPSGDSSSRKVPSPAAMRPSRSPSLKSNNGQSGVQNCTSATTTSQTLKAPKAGELISFDTSDDEEEDDEGMNNARQRPSASLKSGVKIKPRHGRGFGGLESSDEEGELEVMGIATGSIHTGTTKNTAAKRLVPSSNDITSPLMKTKPPLSSTNAANAAAHPRDRSQVDYFESEAESEALSNNSATKKKVQFVLLEPQPEELLSQQRQKSHRQSSSSSASVDKENILNAVPHGDVISLLSQAESAQKSGRKRALTTAATEAMDSLLSLANVNTFGPATNCPVCTLVLSSSLHTLSLS